MAVVWNEFKNLNMRSMRTTMKFVPPNFDQIYDYLNSILFSKYNIDFQKTYSGRAWLAELFINSQAQAKNLSKGMVFFYSFFATISYSAT